MRFLLTLMLIAVPGIAHAQVVVEGATIHDGAGETRENATLVVGDDGRVEEITTGDVTPDAEQTTIDGEGMVVTPGLVDPYTRLGLIEVSAVDRTRDHRAGEDDRIRAAFRVADAFNPRSAVLPVARSSGITSSVIVAGGGLVSGQSAWVDLGAEGSGYAQVTDERVAMKINFGSRYDGSRGAILHELRRLYADVQFYLQNTEDFDQNRSRDLAAKPLELEALGETTTDDDRLPVVFYTHRADAIERAVNFADEHDLRPIIAGATEAWLVADLLAEREVPVIVHPHDNLPTQFARLAARSDNAARLAEAGVPLMLSTFNTHKSTRLRQVAGNAVRAGLDHAAALEAVTATPARVFGRDDLGTLEAGNRANFVVWSGDPFEFSSQVERLFIDGREVSLENRQRTLFERYEHLDRRGEPASEKP